MKGQVSRFVQFALDILNKLFNRGTTNTAKMYFYKANGKIQKKVSTFVQKTVLRILS